MNARLKHKVKAFAYDKHMGQFRHDGVTPYIKHPAMVAKFVRGDDEAEMVAWLHDTIEDTDATLNDIKALGVSEAVVDGVIFMTHYPDVSETDYMQGIKGNALAKKVKIADMLVNLLDEPTKSQVRKYAKRLKYLVLNGG